MQKSEVAKLLVYMQGADRREINELSVEVWHDLLPESVTYDVALDAVKGHYRRESRAMFPADLLAALDDRPDWMMR